jgi:hypothetical protein
VRYNLFEKEKGCAKIGKGRKGEEKKIKRRVRIREEKIKKERKR